MNKYALIMSLIVLLIIELFIVNFIPADWLGMCLAFLFGMFDFMICALVYFALDESFTDEIDIQ
jgi:cell shape-determining protein MreD